MRVEHLVVLESKEMLPKKNNGKGRYKGHRKTGGHCSSSRTLRSCVQSPVPKKKKKELPMFKPREI
jgi:hypothetical protein